MVEVSRMFAFHKTTDCGGVAQCVCSVQCVPACWSAAGRSGRPLTSVQIQPDPPHLAMLFSCTMTTILLLLLAVEVSVSSTDTDTPKPHSWLKGNDSTMTPDAAGDGESLRNLQLEKIKVHVHWILTICKNPSKNIFAKKTLLQKELFTFIYLFLKGTPTEKKMLKITRLQAAFVLIENYLQLIPEESLVERMICQQLGKAEHSQLPNEIARFD